jgi:hypothetical protein
MGIFTVRWSSVAMAQGAGLAVAVKHEYITLRDSRRHRLVVAASALH